MFQPATLLVSENTELPSLGPEAANSNRRSRGSAASSLGSNNGGGCGGGSRKNSAADPVSIITERQSPF